MFWSAGICATADRPTGLCIRLVVSGNKTLARRVAFIGGNNGHSKSKSKSDSKSELLQVWARGKLWPTFERLAGRPSRPEADFWASQTSSWPARSRPKQLEPEPEPEPELGPKPELKAEPKPEPKPAPGFIENNHKSSLRTTKRPNPLEASGSEPSSRLTLGRHAAKSAD